ncbi:MAG: hypothetical protein KBD15_00725 [Candidatus Magasanikbacteria bacterium]|jgi:hypothetical protein|nr:hypothetical protein [Candidatus Magasanikbacteria bacterium]
MNVLWGSQRRGPVPAEIAAIKAIFGTAVRIHEQHIPNAQNLARTFRREGYTDLVCIVPDAVMGHICEQGLRPLVPVLTSSTQGIRQPDLVDKHTNMWFDRFVRMKEVSLILRPVERRTDVTRVLRITRHAVSREERDALRGLFGDTIQIETISGEDAFLDAGYVVAKTRQHGAQDVVLVAPWVVFKSLATRGYYPLYVQCDDTGRFVALWRCYGLKQVSISITDPPDTR